MGFQTNSGGGVVYMARRLAVLLPLLACAGGDSNSPGGGNIPAAVTQVTAVVNAGEIQLNWPSVSGATSYNVFMASENGVTRVNVGTLQGNMTHNGLSTTFDHPPGLDAGTTYYFVVTAQNAAGQSVESCEVSAQIAGAVGGTC
jgi:cellulose 1,4-beta-cellobiosidase